ncbi:hypothetical protein ACIP4X_26060 [Streptomyces sp. NPDC088817]
MDRVGLAAALFVEGEPEQGAKAAQQAIDDASASTPPSSLPG